MEISKWQPMKTAKNDGKLIVCCCEEHYEPFLGYYQERRQCMLADVAAGAGQCGEGFVNEEYLPCTATHWMPLPLPLKA